jgi:AcrR family transcriptional regulator
MSSKAEQSKTTRRALLDAARQLFTQQGYVHTSVDAVAGAAGVTKGALYHQFRDKKSLFQAVFEEIEGEVVERLVAEASSLDDPIEMLRRGAQAFLDACLEPSVRRIALVEAPAVLGWERWREIEQAYGLGVAKLALTAAIDRGLLPRQAVEPLALILFGALIEAALALASADNTASARRDIGRAVTALIDGLLVGRTE